jgi:hypothetical protein
MYMTHSLNIHSILSHNNYSTFEFSWILHIEVPVFRKALIPIPINMSINDLNAKWAHGAHAFVISATPKLKFYHLF